MERRFTKHELQAAKPPPREVERKAIADPTQPAKPVKEIGGPEGPEPTRYGDWERKGICYDF